MGGISFFVFAGSDSGAVSFCGRLCIISSFDYVARCIPLWVAICWRPAGCFIPLCFSSSLALLHSYITQSTDSLPVLACSPKGVKYNANRKRKWTLSVAKPFTVLGSSPQRFLRSPGQSTLFWAPFRRLRLAEGRIGFLEKRHQEEGPLASTLMQEWSRCIRRPIYNRMRTE